MMFEFCVGLGWYGDQGLCLDFTGSAGSDERLSSHVDGDRSSSSSLGKVGGLLLISASLRVLAPFWC